MALGLLVAEHEKQTLETETLLTWTSDRASHSCCSAGSLVFGGSSHL
jgi:hypothetical protein